MIDEEQKKCRENMTDNEIVACVQKDDPPCFDILIARYEQKLLCYVKRFVNTQEEAQDIVQNVFIKAHKHIDSFDCDKKFSSWIYRIAHNESMNYLTRTKQKNTVSIDDMCLVQDKIELSDTTSSSLDEWFQMELRDELHDAVEQLPKHYAQVIRLHYFEDKSYKEISKIINKPTSSVGTLLRRAKKRLLLIVIESGRF
jgi:RNA polymerase sigma-70 factor (ECF subfamily)